MAVRNFNLEWLNHNSVRSYPITEESSRKDITGNFTLPNSFLVGLYLSVNAAQNVQPASFLLMTIQSYATGYSVVIGYDTGSTIVPVAAASILTANHTKNRAYPLRGLGDFYDASGQVVVGMLDELNEQPPGEWNFNLAGARLEVDTIRPQIRGVTQIRVQNGNDLSDPIVGDVVFRAGANFRITPTQVEGQDPVLTFDAIEGAGLTTDCVCDGDTTLAPPIRKINGVAPTAAGDFTLQGSDCLAINPITNGVQLEDTCSNPCCGCKELNVVEGAMEGMAQVAATLQGQLNRLEAEVTQMSQVVLGSRIGDTGCLSG